MRRPFLILALAAVAAAGCTDKADRLAKERIFSPEGPSAEELRAKAPIDLAKVATDPSVYGHVMRMDRMEAVRRFGGQHATTTIHEKWTLDKKTVSLTEKDELFADAHGDFRAVSTNDADAGFEVVFAAGHAYAKSRYGPFHARRLDQAGRDEWLARATAGLPMLDALCLSKLHLVPAGDGEIAGRTTTRFTFQLGPAWGTKNDDDLPPVVFGKYRAPGSDKLLPGPDPDTSRRLRFEQKRVPEAVSGEVDVDPATGVVVAAHAKARVSVPGLAQEAAATLEYDLSFDLASDDALVVKAPADVVDAKLPRPPADPLWFLGDGDDPTTAPPTPLATPPFDRKIDDSPPPVTMPTQRTGKQAGPRPDGGVAGGPRRQR